MNDIESRAGNKEEDRSPALHYGQNKDMMTKCRRLHDYSWLLQRHGNTCIPAWTRMKL